MVRGKLACPVLRGLRRGNAPELPDDVERHPRRWATNNAVVRAVLNAAHRWQIVDDFLVAAGH